MNSTGPNNRILSRQVALTASAFVTLPIAIHYGAVTGRPSLAAVAVILFLLPPLLADLRAQRPGRSIALVLAAVVLWLSFGGLSLVFALPVLIFVSLGMLFGVTLLPGRKPLISAYVELQYDTVSPAMYRYTRNVTATWAVFFAVMAAQSLLLARYAPVEIWSLFANCLNYVFVLALFAGEYLVRKRVLQDRPHASFPQFLRTLARTDFRQLLKQSM